MASACLLATACTAPRAFTNTGKVTPQGEFRAGYDQGFNLASAPIAKAGSAVKEAASQAASADKVDYTDATTQLQAAALAYVLDPVQTTADLYLRYGIAPRLDAGYKYTFGSHVFDAQYQLLGPTGSPENPGAGALPGTLYASIGLQFATQRAKLPSLPFLSDINSVLNLRATRNDVLVPLTFSNSLGTEEEIGAISYGLVYAHSWVSYGFAPDQNLHRHGEGARAAAATPQLLLVRRLRQPQAGLPLRLLHPGRVGLLPELRRLRPAQQPERVAQGRHRGAVDWHSAAHSQFHEIGDAGGQCLLAAVPLSCREGGTARLGPAYGLSAAVGGVPRISNSARAGVSVELPMQRAELKIGVLRLLAQTVAKLLSLPLPRRRGPKRLPSHSGNVGFYGFLCCPFFKTLGAVRRATFPPHPWKLPTPNSCAKPFACPSTK